MKKTLLLVGVLVVGCASYEFTPVTPIALSEKNDSHTVAASTVRPDIMMLVDRSGSMGGSDCKGCATRLAQVKTTMQAFLTANATVARYGVVAFASLSGGSCTPAQVTDISKYGVDLPDSDDPAVLTATSNKVNTVIQSLGAANSTPTAQSLANLATYTNLSADDSGRERFVLLLTDGEPNCNPTNPNNECTATNALCRCTDDKVGCTTTKNNACNLNCLDEDASVTAVAQLRNQGIKTIVIGFGADTKSSPEAVETLNGMAVAGGFGRTCPNGTDAECQANGSADTCDVGTHTCSTNYFQAADGDALAAALKAIIGGLPQGCTYTLSEIPQDPTFLSVSLNGTTLTPGPTTFSYADGKVTFLGDTCGQLNAATSADPVDLEFRILNHL